MVNYFLRALFYWPIRLTANCQPIPFEPLKHIKIDPNKEIVYIMVSSSVGNMLTVERLTNKLGWPSPFGHLNLGGKKLQRTAYLRSPSFFSSNAKVRDISDIIFDWFDACHEAGTDLQVIPITVLWSRDPGIEGSAIKGVDAPTPGWRKFLTLTFAGRDNCTIISNPFSAMLVEKRLLKLPDEQLRRKTINRLISQHFENKARAIVGKPFPNREKLLKDLVQRTGTQHAIAEQMAATGQSKEELEKQAYDIFNVMAADTRYPLLRFFNCIISLIWNKIYHGQSIIGADKVRDLVQSGHEIIYIPCHRSHMDYILLLFAIFHEGLPIPQVASGDNLNFFPVGGIIRRCGSYFIRRKMKGDNFYTALFREYLSVLFERGYATEFFIEGGRSRTGRTLPPRTGMVSMTVQAQLRGIKRPIVFIPTYLGYEHVMEVGSYMHELDGAKKKKESFSDLFGIFKRFRYYGRGYVTFGDPISVPKFLNRLVPNWQKDIDPSGNARPEWLFDTVNQLSHQIIIKLNDSATVNGINLCALAIMGDSDHTMSINMLKRCLKLYLILLRCDESRRDLMPDTNIDTLITQALELNKFHVYYVGDDMKFVRPSHGQSLQLTYFQNNILHLFALPALVANILLRNAHIRRAQVIAHTRSLFYFLRHELFVPVAEDILDMLINKYLDVYINKGYIVERENDILTMSGDGYEEMLILSASIRPNLVRYLLAVTVLRQIPNNSVSKADFIKMCVELCHHVPTEITYNSPEFADPIMFNIMCETFVRHNYFSISDEGNINLNLAKVEKLAQATSPLLSASTVRHLTMEVIDIKHAQDDAKAEAHAAEAQQAAVEAQQVAQEAQATADALAKQAAELEKPLAQAQQAADEAEIKAQQAADELKSRTQEAADLAEAKDRALQAVSEAEASDQPSTALDLAQQAAQLAEEQKLQASELAEAKDRALQAAAEAQQAAQQAADLAEAHDKAQQAADEAEARAQEAQAQAEEAEVQAQQAQAAAETQLQQTQAAKAAQQQELHEKATLTQEESFAKTNTSQDGDKAKGGQNLKQDALEMESSRQDKLLDEQSLRMQQSFAAKQATNEVEALAQQAVAEAQAKAKAQEQAKSY